MDRTVIETNAAENIRATLCQKHEIELNILHVRFIVSAAPSRTVTSLRLTRKKKEGLGVFFRLWTCP